MGIVQFALNGADIGEPWDFYRADLTGSGPVSLGVHELNPGRNLLTVKMLGSNPDAEPNHIFGIDYVKLAPDEGVRARYSRKMSSGVDVIDPIVAAKSDVVAYVHVAGSDADAPARHARAGYSSRQSHRPCAVTPRSAKLSRST